MVQVYFTTHNLDIKAVRAHANNMTEQILPFVPVLADSHADAEICST